MGPVADHKHFRADRKGTLSPARQRFVELMQEINFGRIKGLEVQSGEPVLSASVCIEREIVFGKENTPNACRTKSDFTLRREVLELFYYFDREQNLVVERLEVSDGLPRRMTVSRRLIAV